MLREDQVFAARLALAGPWGHVAAPLAGRAATKARPRGWPACSACPAGTGTSG